MSRFYLYTLSGLVMAMMIGALLVGCSDDDEINGPVKSRSWKPLEHGILGEVCALQVFDDKLYVGGNFDVAGGEPAKNIAIWDGTQWTATETGQIGDIWAFTIYNDELIAGGGSTIIAFDGVSWSQLGDGMPGLIIKDLCVFHDTLFAVGASGNIMEATLFIAAWDGMTWTMIESDTSGYAKAVCVYNDTLVVGGEYYTYGLDYVPYVKGIHGGVWTDYDPVSLPVRIYDLAIFDDNLTVAGRGVPPVKSFSSSWSNFGSEVFGPGVTSVYSLLEFGGRLIAGGTFTTVGIDTVNCVAAWDGSVWSPLGEGITVGTNVFCMAVWNGDLYVGGEFDEAGGVVANNIAGWVIE